MPFDGNGVFVRVRNWVNDAASGIRIRADRHDSEDDNLASGLSQCITRDGQTTITGNLPMSGFKHINAGAATNSTDYARYDQVQGNLSSWGIAGGTADAIMVSNPIPILSIPDGYEQSFRGAASNTIINPTLSVDGSAASVIVRNDGSSLSNGDISADREIVVRYNLDDDRWVMQTPSSITNSDLPSMAANTIKGNNTGSAASPTDITLSPSTILARLASGNIVAATPAEIKTLLDQIFNFASYTLTINRRMESYTLVNGDHINTIVEMNTSSSSPTTITVPAGVFPTGAQIPISRIGNGAVSIAEGSGLLMRSEGTTTGTRTLRARYSGASLYFVSTTEAILQGDLTPL